MTVVALCTPHSDVVSPQQMRAVLQMQAATPQHQYVFVEVDTEIIGKARNMLVEGARQCGAEVVWFVDDDVILPPDAGQLVQQALDLGVVSGLYFNRRPPYTPQIYYKASPTEYEGTHQMYWPFLDYPEGLIKVDAVGAGCLVVRMDIFEKLEKAWEVQTNLIGAALKTYPQMQTLATGLSPWFEFLNKKGEDLYFCERLADIGQQLWANTSVKCQHLSLLPIQEYHFAYLRNNDLIKKAGQA